MGHLREIECIERSMEIKDRIKETLSGVADKLRRVESEWYIIGASALILMDVEVGETGDIDILTTSQGSMELQNLLREQIDPRPLTKEDDLFRSDFARFNLPLMDIEVMGDLQIKKNGLWQNVYINECQEIQLNNITIKLPTIEEQVRILSLFGREKDLRRLKLLKQSL